MSDPIEILERRLNAVLTGESTTEGLHFFCQLGGYDDELGIVTLQVSGSGKVLVSWRTDPEEVDLWTYQFSEEDYRQLIRLFLKFPFWAANPGRRSRRGEETNIHLRVSANDKGTHQGLQFWSEDMLEFPILKKVLVPLTRLIVHLSHEEIPQEELDLIFP